MEFHLVGGILYLGTCLGEIQEKVAEMHLVAYMNQQVKTGA